jgi:hypothetical protein
MYLWICGSFKFAKKIGSAKRKSANCKNIWSVNRKSAKLAHFWNSANKKII